MKILIVDDDELIVKLMEKNLALDGYQTLTAYDGEEAVEMVHQHVPDLIILDIMMPKKDGFQVCRKIRETGIPIIMLTAKTGIDDKLAGLELGADDYIIKPFDSRELSARVKALFRRLKPKPVVGETGPGLQVFEDARRVIYQGEEIRLTPKEYDLLLLLRKNPERVFAREQLLDRVWGYDFFGDTRTVDIHVQRLRKKVSQLGEEIETVFGIGYRYREKKP